MLRKLLKNDFAKKTAFLFSGSFLASILSLLGFFIVAKLYSVDILGEYYMFISIVTILNMIATFGYLQSIPLLKDFELRDMYFAILLLALVILLISSLILVIFYDFWVFLLLSAYLTVLVSLNEQLFVREQKVKELNITRIGSTIATMSFSISSFYLFGDNLFYLILMNILSLAFTNIVIYLVYVREYNIYTIKKVDFDILKEYLKFPKYIGPGMIFHTIAYQVPILVAGNFFSPAIAAYYNMAFKLVYTPASLISGSASQVFMGKLSISSRDDGEIFNGFKKLFIALLSVAIVYIFVTILVLPFAVNLIFGAKWHGSIELSMALLPLVFSLIAISPLTNVFQFTNDQKYIFKLHFFSFIIALISFAVGIVLKDYTLSVWLFSILMFIRYIFIGIKLNDVRREYHAIS